MNLETGSKFRDLGNVGLIAELFISRIINFRKGAGFRLLKSVRYRRFVCF